MLDKNNNSASAILDYIEKNSAEIFDAPMLTALGVGGLLGGGAGYFGSGSGNPNESPKERMKRRLKNAVMGMGIGATVGGLGRYGLKQLSTLEPAKSTTPEGVVDKAIDNVTGTVGTTTAGTAAGMYLGGKLDKKRNTQAESLVKSVNKDISSANFKDVNADLFAKGLSTSKLEMLNKLKPSQRAMAFASMGINPKKYETLTAAVEKGFPLTEIEKMKEYERTFNQPGFRASEVNGPRYNQHIADALVVDAARKQNVINTANRANILKGNNGMQRAFLRNKGKTIGSLAGGAVGAFAEPTTRYVSDLYKSLLGSPEQK